MGGANPPVALPGWCGASAMSPQRDGATVTMQPFCEVSWRELVKQKRAWDTRDLSVGGANLLVALPGCGRTVMLPQRDSTTVTAQPFCEVSWRELDKQRRAQDQRDNNDAFRVFIHILNKNM